MGFESSGIPNLVRIGCAPAVRIVRSVPHTPATVVSGMAMMFVLTVAMVMMPHRVLGSGSHAPITHTSVLSLVSMVHGTVVHGAILPLGSVLILRPVSHRPVAGSAVTLLHSATWRAAALLPGRCYPRHCQSCREHHNQPLIFHL